MERVTFTAQGSCPGASLASPVGVLTEVCRTEHLRLSSDRVRDLLEPARRR